MTVSVTCRVDERAHAVPDTELTAPDAADSGCYQAVCGHLVSPAPMVEPDGRPCTDCNDAVAPETRRRKRGRRRFGL